MFDVILDRDGILNMDMGYTFRIDDFRFPEGAIAALQQLRDTGARFSIATGQSGIARGKYTVEDMQRFNEHVLGELKKHNIIIAALAFCPHHPDYGGDCTCRKPKTGMLQQIEAQLGSIEWGQAWGIGDKPSDSEMMLAVGASAVLVKNGSHNNAAGKVYWTSEDSALQTLLQSPRNFIAEDIAEAARIIISKL